MSDFYSQMPDEIARALYRTATSASAKGLPGPPVNPWLTKPGENGVIQFTDEDDEDKELYRALEPLEKLFHPGNFTSTTPSPSARFRFSKSTKTAAKKSKELRYEKVLVDGELWCHGFDEAGNLQSAMLVIDETDD